MSNKINADSPFDEDRFYLGPLCPHSHNWRETGQSVRNKYKCCRMCVAVHQGTPKAERAWSHSDAPMDYFLRKVKIGTPDECWPWIGCLIEERERASYGGWGYSKPIRGRKPRRAHQAAYLLFKEDIPSDKQVLHTCDNSICCNPNHLYAGTPADNVRDRDERGLFVSWWSLPKYQTHWRRKNPPN